MTIIKICGITNVDDALACTRAGANMLGFVFAESPRRADPGTVRHISRILGTDVRTVGVFTEESDDVLRIVDECGLTYAQLHGGQSEHFARRLGADRVIRAGRIRDESSVNALSQFAAASFYLLDSYRRGMAGGTGTTFDWQLAVRARTLPKPIILSGGLNPDNVADAVRMVRPFGVDASSGLEESPGKKDHEKVKEFIQNVREADRAS